MKKIIYYIASIVIGLTTFSCSNDVLDSENIYGKNLETFYSTPKDIEEAMGGVYSALFIANSTSTEPLAANLMSDMMLAGGDANDVVARNIDGFEDPLNDTYREMWVQSYNGIARCNAIIEKTETSDFTLHFDNAQEAKAFKNASIGEALFMRAFFYFRLGKFFGGVPLITSVLDPVDVKRSSYTEVFAQIASDLKLAIEKMPSTPFTSISTEQYGHANKWVAEAYLARVFLHYTGYMTNIENIATNELPLAGSSESLSSTDITAYLNDCINNSGYRLASDFRNLWPYSYVNEASGTPVLPWAETEGLAWVGQDGHSPTFGTGNYETMFAQRFAFGNWQWSEGQKYTNTLCLFTGVRGNALTPFNTGWGWCTVRPYLWNNWDDEDPRKEGSIIELGNAEQGTDTYQGGQGNHETGYYNKKYTNLQLPDGQGLFVSIYGWGDNDMQLRHAQDFIYMRFADVLLMHSEITQTADGMNAVRARVGLDSVAYSLDALKEERKHELAFEALRWFDLVRWGDVETALNYSLKVQNYDIQDADYNVQYRSETKGLVSLPETEISLSNGVYEQNNGW